MTKGIDVSYANGYIDWEAAKKEIDFAVIRSSFGSEMPSQTDTRFRHNAEGCIRNGIPFGTYHFAYFVDEQTARDEADFAVKLANEYKPHVSFIALDVEDDSVRYAREAGYDPDYTACAIAFLERVYSCGYTPVIYTNKWWLENIYDYSRLSKYSLWFAAPDAIEPGYSCVMWQYSWKGRLSCCDCDTDMDRCYDAGLFRNDGGQSVSYDVRVTSENGVNIRSVASLSGEILGAVPFGMIIHISSRRSNNGYTWGLTEYNGIKGWIALDFTERVNAKSVDELAHEVIEGLWGSGDERKRLLEQAGYDYQAVQNRVNELMSA